MAIAASLKMQNPEAASRMAWCSPPEMLTPCWARPSCTSWAARTLPPTMSAAASYMPSKMGLSGVPRPCPTPGSAGGRLRAPRAGGGGPRRVGGVVHQGEQLDVGGGRLDHLDPVAGQHPQGIGQPHREIQADGVQR